jgi:hypothetical protein
LALLLQLNNNFLARHNTLSAPTNSVSTVPSVEVAPTNTILTAPPIEAAPTNTVSIVPPNEAAMPMSRISQAGHLSLASQLPPLPAPPGGDELMALLPLDEQDFGFLNHELSNLDASGLDLLSYAPHSFSSSTTTSNISLGFMDSSDAILSNHSALPSQMTTTQSAPVPPPAANPCHNTMSGNSMPILNDPLPDISHPALSPVQDSDASLSVISNTHPISGSLSLESSHQTSLSGNISVPAAIAQPTGALEDTTNGAVHLSRFSGRAVKHTEKLVAQEKENSKSKGTKKTAQKRSGTDGGRTGTKRARKGEK